MIRESGTQKGFSVIETIIVLVLAAILGAGITTFTIQTITESKRSNSHMLVIQQLGNINYWVARDVQMAQSVNPGPDAGFPLSVNWTDENENTFQVAFSIIGSEIRRSLIENGGEPRYTLVAQAINPSPALTNCNYTDGLLTFNATATLGKYSLSRTVQILKRPG